LNFISSFLNDKNLWWKFMSFLKQLQVFFLLGCLW
jgi:hypothetical protein